MTTEPLPILYGRAETPESDVIAQVIARLHDQPVRTHRPWAAYYFDEACTMLAARWRIPPQAKVYNLRHVEIGHYRYRVTRLPGCTMPDLGLVEVPR